MADLTGKFKNYDDLRTAYGAAPEDKLDERFDYFLKMIAEKDTVLTNFHPVNLTFDAALLLPDPNDPSKTLITFIDPYYERYASNMGIDKLEDDSISCNDCDEYIYCTGCGLTVPKALRYDYEPKFTYGDIFNGDCDTDSDDNKTGEVISFEACKDGLMFCGKCRKFHKFKELQEAWA